MEEFEEGVHNKEDATDRSRDVRRRTKVYCSRRLMRIGLKGSRGVVGYQQSRKKRVQSSYEAAWWLSSNGEREEGRIVMAKRWKEESVSQLDRHLQEDESRESSGEERAEEERQR